MKVGRKTEGVPLGDAEHAPCPTHILHTAWYAPSKFDPGLRTGLGFRGYVRAPEKTVLSKQTSAHDMIYSRCITFYWRVLTYTLVKRARKTTIISD